MGTLYLLLAFLSFVATQPTISQIEFGSTMLRTNSEYLPKEPNNTNEKIALNISLRISNVSGLPACPNTTNVDGVYNLQPALSTVAPFPVYCEYSTTFGDGWIVVQRRFNGNLTFDRNWAHYRNGFGSLQGEFWLGLENMHQITRSGNYEALVVLRGEDEREFDARYSRFAIGSEFDRYTLNFGTYLGGSAGDELSAHNGIKFSTTDVNSVNNACAERYRSGWWYLQRCHDGNLNIPYENGRLETKQVWLDLHNTTEYLTAVRMMIRSVDLP